MCLRSHWQAAAQIANLESLEIISTVCRNIAVNPSEGKYRKLRLSNAKIQQNIVVPTGALAALQTLGWVLDSDDADSLIFPSGRQLTMAQVRCCTSGLIDSMSHVLLCMSHGGGLQFSIAALVWANPLGFLTGHM